MTPLVIPPIETWSEHQVSSVGSSGVSSLLCKLMVKLNENTSIPLKIILPVLLSLISCTWYLSAKIASYQNNTWTVQDMIVFVAESKRLNPTLNLPNPSAVKFNNMVNNIMESGHREATAN